MLYSYHMEINHMLLQYDVQDEFELYTGNFSHYIKVGTMKQRQNQNVYKEKIVIQMYQLKDQFSHLFFSNAALQQDKELVISQS